jgi:hypothetical protein
MAVSNGNGHGARTLTDEALRDEASHITDAVSRIAEMTDQVSEGADAQIRSLDGALSELSQMTT